MSFDPILVRRLEELAFNAWPALRTVLVGGWVVRLAEGHERRANGASPIHPPFLAPEALIDRIENLFGRAGIEPVYRLTGLQAPGVEAGLRKRGYVEHEPVVVLRSAWIDRSPDDPRIAIEERLDDRWLAHALAAHGWEMQIEPGLRRVFDDIVFPCGFATVREGDEEVAWGLAVAEADHVGLYDLVVSNAHRRQGYGRALVGALLRWGRRKGARRAYLQVTAENAAAHALYRSLGFEPIYDCRHFVRPCDGAPASDAPNAPEVSAAIDAPK